jgi:hypothetical protein
MRVLERATVGLLHIVNHLGYPLGPKENRPFHALERAHLFSYQGTLIEQGENILIQCVNPGTQFREIERSL